MYILNWRPPYDWEWMLNFFGARAVVGIETVTSAWYERSFSYNGHKGLIRAIPDIQDSTLKVTLSAGLQPVAESCLARIARLFDLDCEPELIAARLGDLSAKRPGLRLPGSMDVYEQGVRTILEQLVSVSMAAKLTGKIVSLYGEPLDDAPGYLCFPTSAKLASIEPKELKAQGMPLTRAMALVHLARLVEMGKFPITPPQVDDIEKELKALRQHPGIGRWTASYFALRGWHAKDIFISDDYLIKQRFLGMTPAKIYRYAERWKPYRSYALLYIWYTEGWIPVKE